MSELNIIDMDLKGRGIGKSNGKAVFVSGAVTGDTVTYEVTSSKKRYDIGMLCNIITPSEHRCIPSCPVADICGGCTFIHVDRDTELDVKKRTVESAFRRAGICGVRADKIISDNRDGYRNKAIFHRNGKGEYGFFGEGSHNSVSAAECILIPSVFREIMRFSEDYFRELESAPEDIMLRIGNDGIMIAVTASNNVNVYFKDLKAEFPLISSGYECDGYPADHKTKFTHHFGNKTVTANFCGAVLGISPKSFFQINDSVAEKLCNEIIRYLSPENGDVILDLYCGIGTIGLAIAKHFPTAKIFGVEINESAVRDAKANCIASDIANAEFVCADAGSFNFRDMSPYAVIVDPPRFGLSESMIRTILNISPKVLIYMSCDPGTLAGDSGKLISGGYAITECVAGDMFPRCPHIETVVKFERSR